jgi:hypothetical protein
MASTITNDSLGISAFTPHGQLAMNGGAPCVAWSFRIKELEEWLTTLEEIMPHESVIPHRRLLEGLYFSLKAAHKRHIEEHNEIVTDAPTADDLMQYLAAYAAAISFNVNGDKQ